MIDINQDTLDVKSKRKGGLANIYKSPLNLNFGQDGCSKPGIARPNSNKTVLLKISQRLEIVIFDNNFAWKFLLVILNRGNDQHKQLRLFIVKGRHRDPATSKITLF